ncbi:hypothetical protein SKAU_G00416990 [Synaphobranchus kaupii]|uniref:Ig-like domain-containing protein n=1 Tax=Synaphobranchus kaupii TaxID=118154 RepID=A0A9Q1I8W0_SYNKA|nr:hypothetical protein SKAU_G00416990 [Synaphobranchus kaupii]
MEEGPGRSAVLGRCPHVEVEVGGVNVPCLLDTGSQVTLFTEGFYQRWLKNQPLQEAGVLEWLELKGANGLDIPFIGYVMLDFVVGGVDIPQKGVLIVRDGCVGAEYGVLGMNVIMHCWRELFQGEGRGALTFSVSQHSRARREWEKAFAVCRRISSRASAIPGPLRVRLDRREKVIVPPNSEFLCWGRVVGGPWDSEMAGLVEAVEEPADWCVGRSLVRVQEGKVPLRLVNVHPYPIHVPSRRPLAIISVIEPSQVQGGRDMVLRAPRPGMVEVGVCTVQAPAGEGQPLTLPEVEGLAPLEKQQLQALLQRWSGVFAAHEEDFRCTDAVLHHIPTGTAPPSRERYRPVPPSLYPELRSLLKGMLNMGPVQEGVGGEAPSRGVQKERGSWGWFPVRYPVLGDPAAEFAAPQEEVQGVRDKEVVLFRLVLLFDVSGKSLKEMLLVLILVLVHQFSARVSCRIWVTQSENEVCGVLGGNVTLRCQIHSDSRDEVSECQAQWYIKPSRWTEVGKSLRLQGRVAKGYDTSTTNTTLTIRELTTNDTDIYYCTLICKINGSYKQHHGNKTKIKICDRLASEIPSANTTALPEPDDKAEDGLLPVPFYVLLALKLVVSFIIVTFSVMCFHS